MSRVRRITKKYKFKETKDITPTRDKVSSEWRLFSKKDFVTCRSTYHSSCYRKTDPKARRREGGGGRGGRRLHSHPISHLPPLPTTEVQFFFINQRLKTKLSRNIVLFLFTDCVVKSFKIGHKPGVPFPQNVL